jgi:hypothetical protein
MFICIIGSDYIAFGILFWTTVYILSYLQDNGEAEGLLTLITTTTIIKPYMENSKTLYRKIVWTKNLPYCGLLRPEMEGFAVAIQDWVIKTRNYEKHCLEVEVTDRCSKCD